MTTSTGIMSNYFETKILNHIFRATPYTMPTSIWFTVYSGLTGAGDADSSGTEITTGMNEYRRERVYLSNGDLIIDTADNLTIHNTISFSFAEALTSWGTVRGWGLKDNGSGGNLLLWGMLDTAVSNPSGNALRIGVDKFHMIFSQKNITPSMGGWTVFSSAAMAQWLVNGNSSAFNWAETGTKMALGRNVIENNTTDHLFQSWTEISTTETDYARVHIPPTYWTVPDTYYGITNAYDIVFSFETASAWGSITDIVLYDDITGENPLFWGHLSDEVIVNTGDGFKIPSGTLSLTLD